MAAQHIKGVVLQAATAAILAGAVFLASPTQANAQQFAVGVQFGQPAFDPGPGPRPGFYDDHRWEREQDAIARRDAWLREQAWQQHAEWRRDEEWRRQQAWQREAEWRRQAEWRRDAEWRHDGDGRRHDWAREHDGHPDDGGWR